MSYFSQFGGNTPAKITTYNSGSGTFTPISNNQSWARITLIGGGGGGSGNSYDSNNYTYNDAAGGGGGGGGTTQAWVKINSAISYSVGAGGNAGSVYVNYTSSNGGSGGTTTLGAFYAGGGGGGSYSYNINQYQAFPGTGGSGTFVGGSGGGMQSATQGGLNYAYVYNQLFATTAPRYALPGASYAAGGGSLYGNGGSGAGAGGNNSQAGVGGLIYIEEFIQ